MTSLEKAANSEILMVDSRGKPANTEYIPILGFLYFAPKHQKEGKPNILDSSTVRPAYFFLGVGIHLISMIISLNYIIHSFKNALG